MTRAGWWVGVLLLLPLAQAVPASGGLVLDGDLRIDAPAAYRADVEALYCKDTAGTRVWRLTAPLLHVHVVRTQVVPVGPLPLDVRGSPEEATYVLANATVDITRGAHDGWLGAVVDARHPLDATAPGASVVRLLPEGRWAATGATTEADANDPDFSHDFAAPSLEVGPWASAAYRGEVQAKVMGLDLRLASDENVTLLETGATRDPGPGGVRRETFVTLTAHAGEVLLDVPGGCLAGARSAVARWDGVAHAEARGGELRSASTVFYAEDGPATFEGDLEGRVLPTEDGQALGLDLAGDLRSTNFASATLVAAEPSGRAPWLLLAGLAVASTGTLLLYFRERSHRTRAPPADACLALAHYAIESNHLEEALEWIERAKAQSPTSLRVRWEEAHVLEQLGRAEEAILLYETLDAVSGDGEAAFHLALLHADAGRLTVGAAYLAKALAGSPALLLEVEEDERLARLLRSPDVRAAVARAKRDLGLP